MGTLAGMALAVFFYARHYARYPRTDNAYVQADLVRSAPRVSGPIVQLLVRDNQRVKRGELLIQIDPEDFQVRVEEQRAQLALSEAQEDQAKAAIEQAQACVQENDQRVRAAQASAERTSRDFSRATALMNSAAKAISQQDLDAARASADSASANLDAAKAAERSARAAVQAAQANLEAVQAQRRRAAAALRDAELQLSYTRILAPLDGWVTNVNLPPGNYLTAGQSPLTLVADHTWRVLAYYKETVTGQIRPGQPVKVRLFPFPDKVFEGVVEGIGWGIFQADGTASAATVQLPDISPTVNWVRLAQRFPVRINIPHEDPARPFRIGQTAVVEIDTTAPGSGPPGGIYPPVSSKPGTVQAALEHSREQ
jgi:multidrug resistance efflux pump